MFDFRKESGSPSHVSFSLDGFGQTDELTSIKKAAIDRARQKDGVLILPRIPRLPPAKDALSPKEINFDPTVDSRMILDALTTDDFLNAAKEKQIILDMGNTDFDILGFSDGNRIAINLASEIDKRFPNNNRSRRLHLWSLVGVIDIAENHKKPGKAFLQSFLQELLNITTEETRIRFNSEILNNRGVNALTEKGHTIIPAGTSAKELAASIAKILTFREGRNLFAKQLRHAGGKDMVFLFHIIKRALSVTPNQLIDNLGKNGVRSKACDELRDWDIDLVLPRHDLVVPIEKIGRQIRKLAHRHTERIDTDLLHALSEIKDDRQLGEWFLTGRRTGFQETDSPQPDLITDQPAGGILFPRAKSVVTILKGREVTTPKIPGHEPNSRPKSISFMSGHLAPMLNPYFFITHLR